MPALSPFRICGSRLGRAARALLLRAMPAFFPLILLAGCVAPRPTEKPVPVKFYAGDAGHEQLIVFLPGRGDDIDAYDRSGFIEMLHQSPYPADAVVVDAHIGYYINRSLGERVYEDVLRPYREKGYQRFIVVGISLGGVGALRLKIEYPEIVSGLVLLAPFLGDERLVNAIRDAGSLGAWRRQLNEPLRPEEEIWTWIEELYGANTNLASCTVIAYGEGDKFGKGGALFAAMLPNSNVFTSTGAHNWQTWRKLWSDILSSGRWRNFACASASIDAADDSANMNQ